MPQTNTYITRTEFDTAMARIDTRFDKIETRLDAIEARLDALEEKVDRHVQALMEDNQHKLEAIIEYFDGKFQMFEKRLAAVELALAL